MVLVQTKVFISSLMENRLHSCYKVNLIDKETAMLKRPNLPTNE